MKTWFRLWDNKAKAFVNDNTYDLDSAAEEKENYLLENYPDDPHTVIQIHEYGKDGFIANLTTTSKN